MKDATGKLIILGASGHGKVVADIARLNGYEDIVFLDADTSIKECMNYPVLGSDELVDEVDGDVFIAVGNSKTRKNLMNRHNDRHFPILTHPTAVIADGTQIGQGTVIMAGAIINPNSRIGRGCIINTASSVDHDCNVGDFSHIAVGTHLCGTVNVGTGCWIGAGATVSNNINICDNVTVGAGAVVVRDITEAGVYVGVPARKIKDV